MTNEMIILWQRVELMEKGVIGGTGEFITVEDAQGNKKELEMPEEIHTYAMWKKLGYQVQKGQKAIAQFSIWKYATKKTKDDDGEEEESGKMFMKLASFFAPSQVEAIA